MHTPGPWEYRDDQGQIFGPTFLVAELVAADTREQSSANGRLIAAAPDLLAALKALEIQAIQSDVNSPANEWGREALEMARDAIVRAERANEVSTK